MIPKNKNYKIFMLVLLAAVLVCHTPVVFAQSIQQDIPQNILPSPQETTPVTSIAPVVPVAPKKTTKVTEKSDSIYNIIKNTVSVTVLPGALTPIDMSNNSINRVVCPVDIKDGHVIKSEEKNIVVDTVGTNAFIKFQMLEIDGKEVVSNTPSEFYIVCGRDVYSIVAFPKQIPPVTIYLNSGIEKVKKNLALFEGMPYEKNIKWLVESLYKDKVPESFTEQSFKEKKIYLRQKTPGTKDLETVPNKSKSKDKTKLEMTAVLKRVISVEGEGLIVKEYYLSLNKGTTNMDFNEASFLGIREISKKPLGILVDPHSIKDQKTARLIIVERGGNISE